MFMSLDDEAVAAGPSVDVIAAQSTLDAWHILSGYSNRGLAPGEDSGLVPEVRTFALDQSFVPEQCFVPGFAGFVPDGGYPSEIGVCPAGDFPPEDGTLIAGPGAPPDFECDRPGELLDGSGFQPDAWTAPVGRSERSPGPLPKRPRYDLVRRLKLEPLLLPTAPQTSYHVDLAQQHPRPDAARDFDGLSGHPGPGQRRPMGRLVTEGSLLRAHEAALRWEELRRMGRVFEGRLPALMSQGRRRRNAMFRPSSLPR